jgi:hypothetical protein
LEKLRLGSLTNGCFFDLSHRLVILTYLSLYRLYGFNVTFPGELFPTLIELRVYNFNSVRLTGMTRLQHLVINGTLSNEIIGKEVVYPQLKSFSSYEYRVNDELIPWVFQNATHLSLQLSKTSLESDFLVSVDKKVISTDIYLKSRKHIFQPVLRDGKTAQQQRQ